MPRVTLDGKHVDVPAGTTILAAARALGIDIPTLCQVAGLAPLTTCFVCVVKVVGQRRLLPACATPVAEGMVVVSDAPEVLAARRTAVELLLSDHLGECEAPCQILCPAGFRIPDYMEELMDGRLDAAAAIARDDLVLPAALGRICPRFCENTCRRQERDQPLAIGGLHRHTAERPAPPPRPAGAPVAPGLRELMGEGPSAGLVAPPEPNAATCEPQATGKRVAIVGAGPAGLSAAYHLLKRGHACTLLDERDEPGGMLRHSLDEARLPHAVLAAEIDAVRRLGAQFRLGCRLGRDVTLEQLRGEFDAVLVAVGAPVWQGLTCPGQELAQPASEVLARLARGEAVALDGDVMVVGAGQEAMEAARAAARHGASSVTVLCPRPQAHLPLLAGQIRAAQAGGVTFQFEIEVKDIRRPALRLYLSTAQRDKSARLDCNHLLVATGRDVDRATLAGQGLTLGPRGLAVDRATLATNLPGVFAAGEAVSGSGFCVRAVAYGRAAAESVDQYLHGRPVVGLAHPHTVRYGKLADPERALLLARSDNANVRTARIADDRAALDEASRCLVCGCANSALPPDAPPASVFAGPAVHNSAAQLLSAARSKSCCLRHAATQLHVDASRFKGERRALERDASHPLIVYESHKCIQCGACVAVIEADPRAREKLGLTYVGRGFNVRVAVPWGGKLADALEQLDELAIRCAAACPTSAIVLKGQAPTG